MRISFRVDGSERIGGGHVMRCLALADALAGRGAACTFLSSEMPAALAARIRAGGHRLVEIEPQTEAAQGTDWELEGLPSEAQAADASRTVAAFGGGQAEWLVLDHYRLGAAWQREVRRHCDRILVVDDLANRAHDCDLLLDQTFGRAAADYVPLVPPGCRILTGPRYAPLRPEFAAARGAALERRRPGPAGRLLITLGSTDVGGITGRVLEQALTAGVRLPIDVVLGASAPSLAAVEALARDNPQVRVHVEAGEMARLMAAADLAIGAAGTTSWERCCLGLPAIVLVLAANQRYIAEQLDAAGAHRLVESESGEALRSALLALLEDGEGRAAMAERAARVTDGRGAERLCDAMLMVGKG